MWYYKDKEGLKRFWLVLAIGAQVIDVALCLLRQFIRRYQNLQGKKGLKQNKKQL